jgi:DNA-binding NtrC family response regulator
MSDFPVWVRQLTPGQIESLAKIMLSWHGTMPENTEIQPLEEVEKRYITRAISFCQGDVPRAARALRVGKTTIYRKLKEWDHSDNDRVLIYQASVLARESQDNDQANTPP